MWSSHCSQSKVMELFKSAKCSFFDKIKVKYITQMKILCFIPMIIESLVLIFLFLGVPIIYAVNRDSVLKNPGDHPILRQFAENPVPVIIAMYIVPVAYCGGGILLDLFLHFYILKRNLHSRHQIWMIITGTLLYIKVTLFLFLVFGFDKEDVMEVSGVLLVNILFTFYSMWVLHQIVVNERNGDKENESRMTMSSSSSSSSSSPQMQRHNVVDIQNLDGTLV